MPLFDSSFLTRLEYLSLVSRKVFRGQLMAQRRTKQTGSGIEFADHRQYAAGDDFRYLDWNLYARHDELLLKRFQEEEDLHVYLLLDCSLSMSTENGRKFDLARQLAAALAYIALSDLDRVSILTFSDRVMTELPLTRGKSRILNVMQFVEGLTCSGQATDLSFVSREVVHRSLRPGLIVVLSDLFSSDGFETGINLLRYQGFEPHIVQLHNESDANPGLLGDVEVLDVESGRLQKLTVTEQMLKNYRTRFAEFLTSIGTYCNRYSIGCTISSTDITFDELILSMLRSSGIARV